MRSEQREVRLGEMTAGEFLGSLALILAVMLMVLGLLWFAPEGEQVHADATTEVQS